MLRRIALFAFVSRGPLLPGRGYRASVRYDGLRQHPQLNSVPVAHSSRSHLHRHQPLRRSGCIRWSSGPPQRCGRRNALDTRWCNVSEVATGLSRATRMGGVADAFAEQRAVVHFDAQSFHDAVQTDEGAQQEDAVARRFIQFVLEG
jgi:hypothetical protein